MCFFSLLKYSLVMTIWASWLSLMYTDARTHRNTSTRILYFFFCRKKTKQNTTQRFSLKGNCSRDKLLWMVKVLPGYNSRPCFCAELGSSILPTLAACLREPRPCRSASPTISFSSSCPSCPSRRTPLLSSPCPNELGPRRMAARTDGDPPTWGRPPPRHGGLHLLGGWDGLTGGRRGNSLALRLRTRQADGLERWAEGCKIGWFLK